MNARISISLSDSKPNRNASWAAQEARPRPQNPCAVIHGRVGGSQSTALWSGELAPGANIESVFALTVTNGLYKLNQPLVIGTRSGETMRLIVGTWNWDQRTGRE